MAPSRTTNKENRAFTFASDASDVSDAEAVVSKQRRTAGSSKPRVVIEEDTPRAAKSSSSSRVRLASSGGLEERERALQERLEKMTAERDAIQSEFDSLRELRKTEPERALSEVRRAAEAKSRHAQELISALKTRLNDSERRVRALEAGGAKVASGHASMQVDDDQLERERDAGRARQRELEAQVNQLQLELKTEVASSRALISRVPSGSSSTETAASQASGKAAEDERAIRKLYEDLTGVIVSGVEKYDVSRNLRRFKAIFACTGYHDLQLTLEESRSTLPSYGGSSSQSSKEREDLVYVPHLDVNRDAELLESDSMPPYLLEQIRFDRAAALKFTTNLQRGLSKARAVKK